MSYLKKDIKPIASSYAISRYVKCSPIKVRRILKEIVGRSVQESRFLLEFMPYRTCRQIATVLCMALSNANCKYGKVSNFFKISRAIVDKGPVLKRFQPRAQGRAFPIKKRLSHILNNS